MHWHVLDNQSTPERCWFGQRVNIFSHIFATLKLPGRPDRDGCQSALWDCFGDKIAAMLKMRLPKQSHNALWQPSWPGLPRNLKVANTLAPVDSAGWLCPGITVSCPLSFKGKTGDILIAFTTLFRITFMTLFFCSKRLGLVRIFPSDTLWLEIVTNISLQIIAENI